MPVASLIAGILNQYVRISKARGETQPTWLLAVVGAVNVPALNVDKTVEASKAIAAKSEAP